MAHAMADKFINRLPIASTWSNRTGQFTGLPEHAERLLADERMLMVFPEGARGTALVSTVAPQQGSLPRVIEVSRGPVRVAEGMGFEPTIRLLTV